MAGNEIQKTVYLLTSQHFDLLWRQSDRTYRRIRRDVIDAMLDLLEEFSQFKVFFVQGKELRDYFEERPECKGTFRKFIRQGRIELATGGEALIDLNLVTGESIIRNLISARRYFQKEFGVTPVSACLADAFGACGQIPQILAKSGLRNVTGIRYVGVKDRLQYGDYGAFYWKGLDGTTVLAYQNAMGALDFDCLHAIYGWGVMEGFDEMYENFLSGKIDARTPQRISSLMRQLVNLRGGIIPLMVSGEQHTPRAEVICEILSQTPDDIEVRFSTPAEYAAAVGNCRDIPTISGEMNPELTGCYTTRNELKLLNRELETQLQSREAYDVLTRFREAKKMRCLFEESYRRLGLIQFHDSLAGCHIDNNYNLLIKIGREIRRDMNAKVPTAASGVGGDVFNPLPWKRTELLEVPKNSCGTVQKLGGRTVGFVELPAMGVATPHAVSSPASKFTVKAADLGWSLKDKRLGRVLWTVKERGPQLLAREETGTLWSEEYSGKETREDDVRLKTHEKGSLFERLIYCGSIVSGGWPGFRKISFEKEILILPDWVDVTMRVDFAGKNTELAACFPVSMNRKAHTAIFSTPFGEETRHDYLPDMKKIVADDRTVLGMGWGAFAKGNWPTLFYVTTLDDSHGVTIANRGTCGTRVTHDGVYVSLLRSPTSFSYPAFPVEPTPQSQCNGKHEFRFRLFSHSPLEIPRREAMAFSYPPLRVGKTQLPAGPQIAVGPANILFSCLKPAIGGNGMVLRLFESAGRNTTAKLKLPGMKLRVKRVDLNEENPEPVNPGVIRFKPFEIVTLNISRE